MTPKMAHGLISTWITGKKTAQIFPGFEKKVIFRIFKLKYENVGYPCEIEFDAMHMLDRSRSQESAMSATLRIVLG